MADTRPSIVMLAGPNGAGKSTAAPFLLRDTLGIEEFVNADTIAAGLCAYDPASVAMDAGRIMLDRIHELADARANFAFETTLAARSYAPWLDRLRTTGYRIDLLFLMLPSPEAAVHRVATRVREGGHDVPAETIHRRFHAGIRNFFNLYQPLAHRWRVYLSSDDGTPTLIAQSRTGSDIMVLEDDSWKTFRRFGKQP